MKVNGTEEIIKLLLKVKVGEGGTINPHRTDNLENTLQKVDEMIRNDEFIQSEKLNNVKTEVQFSKTLNESPEAYLHRISKEVINKRESDKATLGNSVHSDKTYINEIVETAARTGLLKDFILSKNEYSNRTLGDFNIVWMSKVIAVFLFVLLIYFLLI